MINKTVEIGLLIGALFFLLLPFAEADNTFKTDMSSGLFKILYSTTTNLNETDPVWTADKADYLLITSFNWANLSGVPTIFASNWSNVSGKPTTFTPSAHNHDASDINAGTLDFARLPSLTNMLTLDWLNITNAPSIFATNWANISDVPSIFATNWGNVSYKPSTFAPTAHNQAASTITAGTFTAGNYVISGKLNVTTNVNTKTLILNRTKNACIFFNGTAIIISNNMTGWNCP